MIKTFGTFIVIGLLLAACNSDQPSASGPEEGVTYKANYDSVRVDWAVGWAGSNEKLEGSFEKVAISAANTGTPVQVLNDAAMEIYVPLIDAGDAKLNSAIVEYVFGTSPEDHMIGVEIISYEGTEATGMAEANVRMAGKEMNMPLQYFVNGGLIELTGTLDLSIKEMNRGFEKLESMYGDGKKIAPQVDIYLIARLDEVGSTGSSGGQSIR